MPTLRDQRFCSPVHFHEAKLFNRDSRFRICAVNHNFPFIPFKNYWMKTAVSCMARLHISHSGFLPRMWHSSSSATRQEIHCSDEDLTGLDFMKRAKWLAHFHPLHAWHTWYLRSWHTTRTQFSPPGNFFRVSPILQSRQAGSMSPQKQGLWAFRHSNEGMV